MTFEVLTIFPDIINSYTNESILKRAQKNKLIKIKAHDLRHATTDRHRTVDDRPFGGGPGMIMVLEPIYKTLKKIKRQKKSRVILLDPAGQQFNQKLAQKYSKLDQLILISGRYEGVDARVEKFIDDKISIGPYVLSGGELPALVIIVSAARLVPGVLGHQHSTVDETFSYSSDYIEYPQYTRPEIFEYRDSLKKKKLSVPPVLLSGNHAKITKWRKEHSQRN